MFGVLGEDRSDAETLRVLVKRLVGSSSVKVKKQWFNGCDELCRKGARCIRMMVMQGVSRFVICHDADGPDGEPVRRKVHAAVVKPSGVADSCIVVPVQELEAWMIADADAIRRVIPSLRIKDIPQPEQIDDPKGWLVDQSRVTNSRPLYVPTMHNERVALHIDFQKLLRKCPSFRNLHSYFTR